MDKYLPYIKKLSAAYADLEAIAHELDLIAVTLLEKSEAFSKICAKVDAPLHPKYDATVHLSAASQMLSGVQTPVKRVMFYIEKVKNFAQEDAKKERWHKF